MGGLWWPAELGGWNIGAESMIWAGGKPLDVQKLWGAAPLEWDNHRHPEVDGRLPMDPFGEEAVHEIRFHLSGLWLPNGDPAPSTARGFQANYAELVRKVGNRTTWGGPTAASTLSMPDGSTRSAQIQAFVHPPGTDRLGTLMAAAVTVIIPAGQFEPAGS